MGARPRSRVLILICAHSRRQTREQPDVLHTHQDERASEHEEGDGGGEQRAGGGVETSERKLWARERELLDAGEQD